jgi:hypothetical protein
MRKSQKTWKRAIEATLRQKGFTAKGGRKTATLTIKRSVEKDRTLLNQREDHSVNWKETINIHREQCNSAACKARALHDAAAINKTSAMTGKIVVVPPKGTV